MEVAERTGKTYECKACGYITSDKRDFSKHNSTRKHLNNTTENKSTDKKSEKYECVECHYATSNKYDYDKHCSTQKHISRQDRDKTPTENLKNIECKYCNYITKSKRDYKKHLSSQKHKTFIQLSENKESKQDDELSCFGVFWKSLFR